MELTWEIAASALAIIMAIGGAAVKWITSTIATESSARDKCDGALERKIDEETKELSDKIDHKHNNVSQQFIALTTKIDKYCDNLDNAQKDIVRLTEAQKMQELQVREIKTELKEGLHELRQGLDQRLDQIALASKTQFEALDRTIREISQRKLKP